MALWSIVGSLASAAVVALFWYLTGSSLGGGAMEIALLMCLFLGSADDPRPALRSMIYVLCFAIVMDSFYMFVLMPRIEDFPMLVLAFAPALLPLGMLGANPATIMIGLMPIAMLTVSETASTDIASFVNGLLATELGVVIGLVVTSIVRLVGAETSVRRILRAGWRDLQAIAVASGPTDRAVFASRMLDRVGLLAPRLADLRLGFDLVELQRRKAELTGPAAAQIGDLLGSLATYFRKLRRRGIAAPEPDILAKLDLSIATIAAELALRHRRSLLLSLSGIRRFLFAGGADPAAAPLEEEMIEPRLAAE
jgi:uncharacterized membrane protein YccC